jgi:hypothetical protein
MRPGRKSFAELSVISFNQHVSPLKPPSNLTPNEARIFREVISSNPATLFHKSDSPLLVSYVQAIDLGHAAKKGALKNPKLAHVWERATRVQSILATKLRLTPRSRTDTKMLSRKLRDHQPGIEDAIAASGVDLDD